MPMQLTFLGAAGTVTGSRFLLSGADRSYLIDCGLFQGGRRMEERNWQPIAIPPDKLDAILLTHAHIDHVGYLPRVVAQGFRGPVFATAATCALLELVLPDSAYLQEQDAAYANKRGFSRHRPALPLYTVADAEKALRLLQPVHFHQSVSLDSLAVTWVPAGHLLGSAILEIEQRGDAAGRRYAGETLGVLLIPAFSVGRTQQVLYHIRKLQEAGLAPDLPVYIDSPMAVDASYIYCRFGADLHLDVTL